MFAQVFCCPLCKMALLQTDAGFACETCARHFAIVNGIPDFFVQESETDYIDEKNRRWLDPEIVKARNTAYGAGVRTLMGMTFGMAELGRRTFAGCRVLEVGMGTGHLTRWMTEVCKPGTKIYAFDFSWPIIEVAKANAGGLPGVTLFSANARGRLPFKDGTFDIVFVRLAPLGPHGVPNAQAAFELLKPGGTFFQAGWSPLWWQEGFTPPQQWHTQLGYESAEAHTWRYPRVLSERECLALLLGRGKSVDKAQAIIAYAKRRQRRDQGILGTTEEWLEIAHKPG